jgi:hypothetical protein
MARCVALSRSVNTGLALAQSWQVCQRTSCLQAQRILPVAYKHSFTSTANPASRLQAQPILPVAYKHSQSCQSLTSTANPASRLQAQRILPVTCKHSESWLPVVSTEGTYNHSTKKLKQPSCLRQIAVKREILVIYRRCSFLSSFILSFTIFLFRAFFFIFFQLNYYYSYYYLPDYVDLIFAVSLQFPIGLNL